MGLNNGEEDKELAPTGVEDGGLVVEDDSSVVEGSLVTLQDPTTGLLRVDLGGEAGWEFRKKAEEEFQYFEAAEEESDEEESGRGSAKSKKETRSEEHTS